MDTSGRTHQAMVSPDQTATPESNSPPASGAERDAVAPRLDPRVRRTRATLRQGMQSLLETQAFDTISVQQITERADLNRATFYAHYTDREALLEDLIRSRFEELLEARHVAFDGTCPSALKVVILAVYDFLQEMTAGCRSQQRHFDPVLQTVVQAEVEKVLLIGLEKGAFQLGAEPALVAAALSWAIYGSATRGSATRSQNNPEQASQQPQESAETLVSQNSEIAPIESAHDENSQTSRFVDDIYNLLLPLIVPSTRAQPEAIEHI